MQAIICASKHRFNVLGQYRQTQYTTHCNKRHNNSQHTSNNSHNSKNIDTNCASDICTGPFHSII